VERQIGEVRCSEKEGRRTVKSVGDEEGGEKKGGNRREIVDSHYYF